MTQNDEKKISEREAVMRERKAFVNGAIAVRRALKFNSDAEAMRFISDGRDPADIEGIAAREYPLPKVTRPRVVPDPERGYDQKWRFVGGEMQYHSNGQWFDLNKDDDYNGCRIPTIERIRVWSLLIANPTELVDADA